MTYDTVIIDSHVILPTGMIDKNIIIDDGSHFPKDVIKSFNLLFSSLKENGLYFVEDTQTSYNHFFKGNPFNLKYANTHMNFFKNLTDTKKKYMTQK